MAQEVHFNNRVCDETKCPAFGVGGPLRPAGAGNRWATLELARFTDREAFEWGRMCSRPP